MEEKEREREGVRVIVFPAGGGCGSGCFMIMSAIVLLAHSDLVGGKLRLWSGMGGRSAFLISMKCGCENFFFHKYTIFIFTICYWLYLSWLTRRLSFG